MTDPFEPRHPGARIKAEVIPLRMTVTKAAEIIGVGRPALSNLLNGKAALSIDMATRLEKAFGYPLDELMEMQAQYDASLAKLQRVPANAKIYVPPYLAIKANDIERWALHNVRARTRLAVFLRTLVNSTSAGLSEVDFPGNDDAERPGWDGHVEANEATPWIPKGRSGWEFGTNIDPRGKADGDYNKSVKALEEKERSQTTFVFVTPRRWAGKTAWIEAKGALGHWADVRAYDASDLEQWLEQSLPAQTWFANEIRMPAQQVRSLDKCWTDWADASSPPLVGTLFNTAIETAKRTMLSRLASPPGAPIVISADSAGEALAFLAQLFSERGGEELARYRDRILVFDEPGTLPRLAMGAQTFIAVASLREVERELAPYSNSIHSIVIYPRNASIAQPDIVLEPENYENFDRALEEMSKGREEISRLSKVSGRSLTVLRRQLSTVPAIRTPEWAENHQTAASLVPFLFVGAWNSQNETDKLGLALLADDRTYDELEKICQNVSQLDDAPIWSIGTYRGVISKIDLLYAISGTITQRDLTQFFSLANLVLREDDPALDLDEDNRWAAAIHGKAREFSSAFREGISETLVLLAVHGGQLFRKRLGIDTEVEAIRVVRDLLQTPLTPRVLEANDRDLPTYAEAAPSEFLSILERDLKLAEPAVLSLLRPASTGAFGRSPSRTGLLWALEGLSWNPATLPRAAFILARLAQVEIKDNWVNKPTHSLASIFRAWMPQTAANHHQRVDLMRRLAEKFPDIAWKICISQFGTGNQLGDYSHKPRWRTDGYGFGEPYPTWDPIIKFTREMVEMALTWRSHSLSMLCDLVDRLEDMSDEDQVRVWTLVEAWAATKATDADKAAMREKIRISTLSRRAALRAKKNGKIKGLATKARSAYAALEPNDLLNKHSWLFRSIWLEESADEIEEIEKFDHNERDKRITNLRTEALREILLHRGLSGILKVAKQGKAEWVIGGLAASALLSEQQLRDFIIMTLLPISSGAEESTSYKNLVSGALHAFIDDNKRETLLRDVIDNLGDDDKVQLLLLAPFRNNTWKIVDELSEAARANYWNEVTPQWIHSSTSENSKGVERLLRAGRPRAAFSLVRYEPDKHDPQILFRILSDMAQGGNDRPGQYMLEDYHVEAVFKRLDAGTALTLDQKAGLEFAYIEALARPWDRPGSYGIPNLERYVEAHPELFVQAIAWIYKRKDGAADPPELQVPPERIKTMAERGYKLLGAIERIPGHNDLGELERNRLAKWISTVRQSCGELDRSEIADVYIGKLLSNSPIGKDNVWPCEPVRDVMEDIQSESMISGTHTGVYNSRGAHWRGEDGNQERDIAEKYLKWSQNLQISHPFVSSNLLISLYNTYIDDANREDIDASIRRRLR